MILVVVRSDTNDPAGRKLSHHSLGLPAGQLQLGEQAGVLRGVLGLVLGVAQTGYSRLQIGGKHTTNL